MSGKKTYNWQDLVMLDPDHMVAWEPERVSPGDIVFLHSDMTGRLIAFRVDKVVRRDGRTYLKEHGGTITAIIGGPSRFRFDFALHPEMDED